MIANLFITSKYKKQVIRLVENAIDNDHIQIYSLIHFHEGLLSEIIPETLIPHKMREYNELPFATI